MAAAMNTNQSNKNNPMKTDMRNLFVALAMLSVLTIQPATAFAQGTAFSYQGQLSVSGSPANGSFDLTFTIYDSTNNPGNVIGGSVTNSSTAVSNGLIVVTLDFGSGVFTGPALWLEIGVRTNGGGTFNTLSPRQPLMAGPYAIMANSASNLLGTLPASQLSGTVPLAQLPGAMLTNNQSSVILSGTFSGNGAGLTNVPGTVPSGAIVLSLTATNAALTAAGFAPTNLNLPTIPAITWVQATNSAPWAGRSYLDAVVLNGRIWVFGGYSGNWNNIFTPSDVWSSPDGVNWTEATSTGWPERYGSAAVVFNGRMWAIGGTVLNGDYSDSMYSADGVNWTSATNTPWGRREYSAAVVFNGRIWAMGGSNFQGNVYNDVWSSGDGTNWTQVTNHAAWASRAEFAAVVFNGQMWVMGGYDNSGINNSYDINDVWSSPDGVNWTQAPKLAPWEARDSFAALVWNGRMWIMGGEDGFAEFSDVWSSPDGVNWTQSTAAAPSPRLGLGAVVFNNQMWEMGGGIDSSLYPNYNDVWYLQTNSTALNRLYFFQKQ